MSTSHPDPPAGSEHLTFDDQVSVVFGGGYPVTGALKAVTPHPDGDFAVVIVSADAGLYRQGDVITPRFARLTKAAPS
jgi:hypothetical protein